MGWYYSIDGKPVGPFSNDDIESLFLTDQIDLGTLVWKKGMPQWLALSEVPDFAGLGDETPPPLPPPPRAVPKGTPLVAPTTTVDFLEQPVAQDPPPRIEPKRNPFSVVTDNDASRVTGEVRPEPIFNFGRESETPHLAGPWTRYFARTFDMSVISTGVVALAFLGLSYVSVPLYLQAYAADARILFILSLPFAHLLNAVLISVFGNSMGKALFAIKAVPTDGRDKFGFGANVARELRVWTEGLALGIPFVGFFTMIPAYRKVAAGQPAPYDLRRASVRSYSRSKVRRALAMILVLGLVAAILYLNATDKVAQEAMARPSSWTNPETRINVTIPGNWQYEAVTGPDGASLSGFTNMKTGVVALLGHETFPDLDLQGYANGLKRALAKSTPLGNWNMSTMPGVWKASGKSSAEGWPTTIYITKSGSDFWRIVYLDQFNTIAHEIAEPAMSEALFRSVKSAP